VSFGQLMGGVQVSSSSAPTSMYVSGSTLTSYQRVSTTR